MLEAFEKYKSHPFFKYFLVLFSVIVVYLAYNIYIWSHTESTDNAYIEADISSVSSEISGVIKNVLISDNMRVKKVTLLLKSMIRIISHALRRLKLLLMHLLKI
ncbi:MAG: hypothetical protein LN575_03235 [Rickettsia endosymbiont of Gnoriste bilineata]|nr:hypothetical protein [Rickettsia endosymbiont of Gnoriste bilineata]